MVTVFRPALGMAQALTVLTALQMFSDGGPLAKATATGEPYGINRAVVEGAAIAGASFNTPPPSGRDLNDRPVPALSQVTPTRSPDPASAGGGRLTNPNDPANNEIGGDSDDYIPLVPERTSCNAGLGEMRFEKLPDVRLAPNSYDSDVIRKNAMPAAVLALCEDRCLKDRTATQQLTRRCGSIDFVPGRRFSSYSNSIEYTETKCFLSQPLDDVVAANSRSQYERANNYAHLREVCYSPSPSSSTEESVLRRECPDRLYVMERLFAKSFLPKNVIEVGASTLQACQSICLHQQAEDPLNATTICRSGTWDRSRNRCFLSSYTRRTHPTEFKDSPDMDYFENTCLSAERRCPKNRLFFVKETNAEMGGPFDLVTLVNVTLEQCQEQCIESRTIFCRSMEYDHRTRLCILSDEDSVSRREEIRASTSMENVYYEFKCFDGDQVKGGEYLFEAEQTLVRSPNTERLNSRTFRDVRTAFQLYRNRHLELRSGFRDSRREKNRLTLAECLDECLEERNFACRSVMYAQRYLLCRLSEYDQYNGELIYDGEYDYFENLMGAGLADLPPRRGGSNSLGFNDNRNTDGGNRFASSSSGNRNSGSSSSRNPFRGSGSSRFGDQPGLFRPISTEFHDRDAFNTKNRESTSNRNTGPFGFSNNRGSSSSGTFDLFGTRDRTNTITSNRINTRNDRFNNVASRGSSAFGSGRFSSTAQGSSGTDLFGSNPLSGTGSFGLSNTGSDLGSGGVSTSILGNMPVAQSCNEDGSMEFTLRTEESFRGRIYAYGYYDRCFFVGRGSSINVLQLSGPRGFPDCGTTRYADTVTNIIVVQFSENVQTMMDKRYNLTCTTIGPSDSVVTSGYIGAGSAGAPTPIEYLALEKRLDQRVTLRVLYDGRPTTTIAVGDPLTFRLEPQPGYNLVSDIFATNVVAKDPYSGRAVQLIDSRGCPVDNYIFPALGRARNGDGLETRFSAFKIPQSNFLVFEANVRPCKEACTPAFCRDNHGRGDIESRGRRRRRDLEDRLGDLNETSYINITKEQQQQLEEEKLASEEGSVEHVHGIYEVYLSRDEIPVTEQYRLLDEVCLSTSTYHGLMVGTVSSVLCLVLVLVATWLLYRRYMRADSINAKNVRADASNPHQLFNSGDQQPLHHEASRGSFPGPHPRTVPQPARYFPNPNPEELRQPSSESQATKSSFTDPSEPIYTDPTLFEKATSVTETKSKSSTNRGFQV